jgi:hypothetical protein
MDMTISEKYLVQFEEKLPIFHVEKLNKVIRKNEPVTRE